MSSDFGLPTTGSTSSSQVLLTGATGYIGFQTLLTLLRSPYNNVRCAVRDRNKAQSLFSNPALSTLLSNPSISSTSPPSAPTFVAVPDITAKGAYDEAIKDITHVVHIASPLPRANINGYLTAQESYINPAVRGALEVLDSAQKTSSVQRVVITSSVTSLVPFPVWLGVEVTDKHYGGDTPLDMWPEPYQKDAEAYAASKTAQRIAIEEWVEKNNPKFDVVILHPSWVFGRGDLSMDVESLWYNTNRRLLEFIIKGKEGLISRQAGAVVDVSDVAEAHVRSLSLRKGEKVRRYALNTSGRYEDIKGWLERDFPEAIQKGVLNPAQQETATLNFDGSPAEKELGFKYKSLEQIVHGLVQQYLELKAKEEK